ncbi:hypothetical protein BZG36_00770 [Bifiguratus adelaidae]|uniref:Uncharacterized protein n=1 Tax=Bifiguratus adelaidae TaxID=1938954 RepID=A0A261Y6Q7_9FUNG|nr:hypothetical protein BZG36_00770 [Bifiguratus adelaidae]
MDARDPSTPPQVTDSIQGSCLSAVDAIAPVHDPLSHPHKVSLATSNEDEPRSHLHSLSPEKLGVVGYIKDVGGFVKDLVHDRKVARQQKRKQDYETESMWVQAYDEDDIQDDDTEASQGTNHPVEQDTSEGRRSFLRDNAVKLFPAVHESNTYPEHHHQWEAMHRADGESVDYSADMKRIQ